MKDKFFKIIKKICCLPPVWTLVIAIPSYVLVILALTGYFRHPAVAYMVYVLSAYALVITITGINGIVRMVRAGISQHPVVRRLAEIPYVGRFMKERTFRTEAALYPGFLINTIYVIFKLGTGIYYRSAWFLSLAVYYLMLALMRLSLIRYVRKREAVRGNEQENEAGTREAERKKGRITELKKYRFCGCLMLGINLAFVGIAILAVTKSLGFEYPGMLIYAMATYTFYAIISAVINVVKYRQYGSPVMSAAKVINLTTAMVSMFSLETAMLTQFAQEGQENFRRLMTSLTGGCVSVILVAMACYMIIRGGREIRKEEL